MSGDCKEVSINGINRGIRTAENRIMHNVRNEMAESERRAVRNAVDWSNRRINGMRDELNGRINKLNSRVTSMDSRVDKLGNRIIQIQRELGAEIDTLAQQTNQALVNLNTRHTNALNTLSNNIYDALEQQGIWMANEIDRMDNNIDVLSSGMQILGSSLVQLSTDVNTRFKEQQGEINSLRSGIQQLLDDRATSENEKLLQAGRALASLEELRESFPDYHRFAPQHLQDRVAEKECRLRGLRNNPHSCTISDANDLLDDVLVMKNEANRRRNEWINLHTATLLAAKTLLHSMKIQENHKIKSLYDENEEEEIKVDYWTHGRYSAIQQKAENLLREAENCVDMERLKQIMSCLTDLNAEAKKLIITAAELGMKSEERIIISNEILNVMVAQGWELQEDPDFVGGETESDWREGTFAILKKPGTGEELSILVTPQEEDGQLKNKLTFHRNDHLIEAPGAFQARMQEIKAEIEKSGYQLGSMTEPACGGTGKIPQLRSGQALRQKGAAEKMRKTMTGR